MKTPRPRRPTGRWVYYILYDGIIWPCPVRWEWESGFGDPGKAYRIARSDVRAKRREQEEREYV